MVTAVQSTVSGTITADILMPVTVVVPRTIIPGIDEQTADTATDVFYLKANRAGRDDVTSRTTVAAFIRATLDGSAVTVLYTHDGDVTARTLFPSQVWLTGDEFVSARCYCTYRNTTRTFRLDRMTQVQHVTMPGEIAA